MLPNVKRLKYRAKIVKMEVITVGRHPDNKVVINDPIVGHRYSQTTQDNDGRFSVLDLNTTNGTYINGKRVYMESPD